jgi:hypothetical protein
MCPRFFSLSSFRHLIYEYQSLEFILEYVHITTMKIPINSSDLWSLKNICTYIEIHICQNTCTYVGHLPNLEIRFLKQDFVGRLLKNILAKN